LPVKPGTEVIEIASAIQLDGFPFPNGNRPNRPGGVIETEFRAQRSIFLNVPVGTIGGRPSTILMPDSQTTAAAARPDLVAIQSLSLIFMIIITGCLLSTREVHPMLPQL